MVSTPDSSRYRAKHDPYNDMESAITRPKNIKRGELSDAEKLSNAEKLSDAEKQASKNLSQFDKATQLGQRERLSDTLGNALRRAEEAENSLQRTNQSNSHFRSLVGKNAKENAKNNPINANRFGKNILGKNKKNKQKKGLLSRLGPVGIIFGLLFGGAGILIGSQTLLGAQISEYFTKATDIQFTSNHTRNQRLIKYALDGGDQIKISDFTKKYTNFSPWLKKRLAKNGIEVGKLDIDGNFHAGNIISTQSTVLKYGDKIITANDFQDVFIKDVNFQDAYYKAKRGRIGGFFDKVTDSFYTSKQRTRDIFNGYKNQADANENRSNFENTINKHTGGTDSKISSAKKQHNEETDTDEIIRDGNDVDTKNLAGDTPESKARSFVNSIAGKVTAAGNIACSALRLVNIAGISAMAYQIVQAVHYFLGMTEPISKTIAGEGDTAPINETLNTFTETKTVKHSYVDDDGNLQEETLTGSMMDSAGAKVMLGGYKVSTKETSSFSAYNLLKAATFVAGSSTASTLTCDAAMASGAIISIASTMIPGGKLAKIAIGFLVSAGTSLALSGVVMMVADVMMPFITKMFTDNTFMAYQGIEAGNFFSIGAAQNGYDLARNGNAAMPGSASRKLEQDYQTTQVNKIEAAVNRRNSSPFDATNPDTFLGSLVNKFGSVLRNNSVAGGLASLTNTTLRSVSSLTGNVYADENSNVYTSITQECEYLEGAVCDMYGQPIPITDYSTIDLTPDDPAYQSAILPNLDDSQKIKENSELAKYITYCVDRESPWGVMDANILNSLQSGNVVLNSLPVIGDVIDLVNAAEDVQNQGWATGTVCMNSEDNERWNNEFKYYQRYIEDMRLLGAMSNDEETNPVIAYREDYEEKHPKDYSYEGTLARISGMTKNDIAFMLEYMDYSTQIANYHPEERLKLGTPSDFETQILSYNIPETTPEFASIYAVIYAADTNITKRATISC